jgi:hypothetical protein
MIIHCKPGSDPEFHTALGEVVIAAYETLKRAELDTPEIRFPKDVTH